MANLDYKSKISNTKHIFPFPFFLLFFLKATYHEMHECNAMQILKAKRKTKTANKEWSQRVF